MYLRYEELMKLETMKDSTIIGGKSGTDRLIKWVHVLDEDDVKKWVKEGMLIIRTGVSKDNSAEILVRVIKDLSSKGAAGLCLLPGGLYIEDIPKNVIEAADKYDLPLIKLTPYHFLADVTYQIAQKLFENRQKFAQLSDVLADVIKTGGTKEDVLKLEERGYSMSNPFQVATIKLISRTGLETELDYKLENGILEFLRIELRKLDTPMVYSIQSSDTAFFLLQLSSNTRYVRKVLLEIFDKYKKYFKNDYFLIGVGSKVDTLNKLVQSAGQSKQVIDDLLKDKKTDELQFYEMLGMKRFFPSIERDELKSYVLDSIGGVIGNEDLLETLRCFLENNGNYRETSEQLYIHISTLRYMIEKIEEILYIDLKNFEFRNNLYNSLQAFDYLKKHGYF